MRKVVLYIAMSLDGYIADAAGGVAWLGGDGSEKNHPGSYPAFYESVDTILLGYTTYHQIRTELFPEKWIYSGKTSYVMTHKNLPSTEEIIFTDKSAGELIGDLRCQSGKDIWLCGGANIANQFMNLNLIDRYCVTVIPTILGDGIRLFEKHGTENKLSFVSTKQYNGMIDLVYERRI